MPSPECSGNHADDHAIVKRARLVVDDCSIEPLVTGNIFEPRSILVPVNLRIITHPSRTRQ